MDSSFHFHMNTPFGLQLTLSYSLHNMPVWGEILKTQEEGVPGEVVAALEAKGHAVRVVRGPQRRVFGKGAIITRDPDSGVLCGGCDPRGDGCVIAW